MNFRSVTLGSVAAAALFAGSAFAADLPVRTAAPAPVLMAAPIFSWTGFYVGVNAGYAGNKFEYPFSGDVNIREDAQSMLGRPGTYTYGGKPSITSSGGVFGGQVGYNWQFANRWVVGLEADYQWANIEGRANINGFINPIGDLNLSAGSEITGFGTVRARLGYGWDRALFYVTGGWAYGSVKSSASLSVCELGGGCLGDGPLGLSKKTSSSAGWTLGAGLEYALTNNVSFKTEYLYVDLGKKTLYAADYDLGKGSSATARLDVDTKIHVVRAGLNYRFGWGSAAAPVVARY